MNGIKQGSIASPTLFCVYLDVVLDQLRKDGIGCRVGEQFYGCLVYADDVVLLSPTIHGLQRMVRTCEKTCRQLDIEFNASKSMCMRFLPRGRDVPDVSITLGENELGWMTCVKHLGNYLQCDLGEETEIRKKRGEMFGRTNALLGVFSTTKRHLISRLFHAQCCHHYGAQAWNLRDPNVGRYSTAYNSCVRRLFKLPRRTHTRFLPLITKRRPVIDVVYAASLKNIVNMSTSDNMAVLNIYEHAMNDCTSLMYENHRIISNHQEFIESDDDRATVTAILELMFSPPECFDSDEALQLANFLCIF